LGTVGIQPHVPKPDIESVVKMLREALALIGGLPFLNWMDRTNRGEAESLIEEAIYELEE